MRYEIKGVVVFEQLRKEAARGYSLVRLQGLGNKGIAHKSTTLFCCDLHSIVALTVESECV